MRHFLILLVLVLMACNKTEAKKDLSTTQSLAGRDENDVIRCEAGYMLMHLSNSGIELCIPYKLPTAPGH